MSKNAQNTIVMDNKLIDISSEIGKRIIENGGEVSRAEDTIRRILASQGIKNFSVFCINSVVIVGTDNHISIKRITKNDLNLFEIDKYNSISRAICNDEKYIPCHNKYHILTELFAIILGTGSFCIYFGGSLVDSLIAGIIGIIIFYLPKISNAIFCQTFIQSTVAGILSFVPFSLGLKSNPNNITMGAIMLLVPGITISTAIRDIMYSDTISGIIELTESIFVGLAIALGIGASVIIFGN